MDVGRAVCGKVRSSASDIDYLVSDVVNIMTECGIKISLAE